MQGFEIKTAGRSRLTTRGEEKAGRGRPARRKTVMDQSQREEFSEQANAENDGRGRKSCTVSRADEQMALVDRGQQTLVVQAARVLVEKSMQLREKR